MKKIVLSLASVLFLVSGTAMAAESLKIGFNLPLTGDIPKVGESSRHAAEMLKEDINAKGGLVVGGKKYPLNFIYEDNESKAESAVNVSLNLI